MNIRTKEEIVQYMMKYTENFRTGEDLDHFTTHAAAREIQISRNLASFYLNELVKEGILIKIKGRPVYFFHKKILEKRYHIKLAQTEYDFLEDLWDLLDEAEGEECGGENVIGFSTTLNYCISQCKSAVKYPGSGVPVLIWGEAGTGKSYLAEYLYRYAIENQSIDKDAPFRVLECSESEAAGGMDHLKLFGKAGKRQGLLKEAEGGVLFINNIDNMSEKGQELLAAFLAGRRNGKEESRVKLILSSRKNPSLSLREMLLEQIPVISFLPPLRERSLMEKRLLMMRFFEKEESCLNRCITISSNVYRILMEYPFEGNLAELKSCIKVICANAFLQSQESEGELEIKSYHLPSELISAMEPEETKEGNSKILISNLASQEDDNYFLSYLKQLLEIYESCRDKEITLKELMKKGNNWLDEFYDYIVYEKKYSNMKIKALEEITGKVLSRAGKKHAVFLPSSCEYVLARLLYIMTGENSSLMKWMNRSRDEVREFLQLLGEEYPAEAFMAREIKRSLEELLDVALEDINAVFLILNIRFYNRKLASTSHSGLVIAHGYSTASSIADAVNKLIGKRVLEGFDMPLNTDVHEIVLKIKEGISDKRFADNLILLVDMGTLEELGTIISECSSARIGIINNISTKIALSVGEGIANGDSIEDILKQTCDCAQIEYRLYDNSEKEPAILFASESGVLMTNRVLQIFQDSFPKGFKIRLLAIDSANFMNMEFDALCARYEILFVSGTMDPQIPEIPYVGLEDIIASNDMEKVNSLLKRYMSREELAAFDEKLLKNFTLQNVLQYLTILNADKLLEYIKDAVGQLQSRMNRKFSNKTIIGIYIHVCCLIERLVTKTPITAHEDLESFVEQHQDFTGLLTESFQELTAQYNVEIPISEMAYLYDYIRHDH